MEEGLIDYGGERTLSEGGRLGLAAGGRPQAGGSALMEPSGWLPGPPAGPARLEDARNLVAFSAVAEAVSSYRLPAPASPSLLYKKFDTEMSRGGWRRGTACRGGRTCTPSRPPSPWPSTA